MSRPLKRLLCAVESANRWADQWEEETDPEMRGIAATAVALAVEAAESAGKVLDATALSRGEVAELLRAAVELQRLGDVVRAWERTLN